ncbi:hypothetical protein GQX73_g1752 [Xylaria multiplex]|uniref:Uncharacterized protein n=1 Tax=Xylaria multiplex TaxID=323545 RepID=A0A7C8IW37_9PEZI|nr:hypothetical protein GQX73_g1752 [Xylaria multiplex]
MDSIQTEGGSLDPNLVSDITDPPRLSRPEIPPSSRQIRDDPLAIRETPQPTFESWRRGKAHDPKKIRKARQYFSHVRKKRTKPVRNQGSGKLRLVTQAEHAQDDVSSSEVNAGTTKGNAAHDSISQCDQSEKPQLPRDLIPGEIYLVCYEDGKWYEAVLLPLGNFKDIGVTGSIDHITRSSVMQLPPCYEYKDRRIVGWADDYKEGGSSFDKREYPCFYLDSVQVPEPTDEFLSPDGNVYDWKTASQIQPLQSGKKPIDDYTKHRIERWNQRLSAARQAPYNNQAGESSPAAIASMRRANEPLPLTGPLKFTRGI